MFGCEARDLRQEPAVLLPAEMEAVAGVRVQGRHEDGLVEGLLEVEIEVCKENETSQSKLSRRSNYGEEGKVRVWREKQGRAHRQPGTATARHSVFSGHAPPPSWERETNKQQKKDKTARLDIISLASSQENDVRLLTQKMLAAFYWQGGGVLVTASSAGNEWHWPSCWQPVRSEMCAADGLGSLPPQETPRPGVLHVTSRHQFPCASGDGSFGNQRGGRKKRERRITPPWWDHLSSAESWSYRDLPSYTTGSEAEDGNNTEHTSLVHNQHYAWSH